MIDQETPNRLMKTTFASGTSHSKRLGITWHPQNVIEAFYVEKAEGMEPWIVAYEESDSFDERSILTDIHYEWRTIWVTERLRGRKKKRDEEILKALKTISEIEYGGCHE